MGLLGQLLGAAYADAFSTAAAKLLKARALRPSGLDALGDFCEANAYCQTALETDPPIKPNEGPAVRADLKRALTLLFKAIATTETLDKAGREPPADAAVVARLRNSPGPSRASRAWTT